MGSGRSIVDQSHISWQHIQNTLYVLPCMSEIPTASDGNREFTLLCVKTFSSYFHIAIPNSSHERQNKVFATMVENRMSCCSLDCHSGRSSLRPHVLKLNAGLENRRDVSDSQQPKYSVFVRPVEDMLQHWSKSGTCPTIYATFSSSMTLGRVVGFGMSRGADAPLRFSRMPVGCKVPKGKSFITTG